MTNLREIIDHYHSLLDPETARETHEHLTEQLQRRGLFFGDRPLRLSGETGLSHFVPVVG